MQSIKKNGDLVFDNKERVLHITKEFLDKWRQTITALKDGKAKDRATARYLIVHKMYVLANSKNNQNATRQ